MATDRGPRGAGPARRATDPIDGDDEVDLSTGGGYLSIDDLTGDGRPEIGYTAYIGAHSQALWVLSWDGMALAPIFARRSLDTASKVEDLDADGIPEIVLGARPYCGGRYWGGPSLQFVMRWRDGAYRPASADFPSIARAWLDAREQDRADEGASHGTGEPVAPAPAEPPEAWSHDACLLHAEALTHALLGEAGEAKAAYDRYRAARLVPSDVGPASLPRYVRESFFEAEARDLVTRAEDGRLGSWGPDELAVLHALLDDARPTAPRPQP
jgi:hypothetical protein